MKLIFCFIALACNLFVISAQTIKAPAREPVAEIKWHHPYHQTLMTKVILATVESVPGEGKQKKIKDKGESKVELTFEEVLEVIKKTDRLTIGIPKIIYLVGWQYNGHDSKYPSWDEVNPCLKRPQDKTALESMKWLMKEARRYNTTVSVHVNMMDALEDSPLWDTYLKHNIIAKNTDGSLKRALWGWVVSYTGEWEAGFAQKRIDRLCKMLSLDKAGTIHIDAFHTWVPLENPGPISPYLGYTPEKEAITQRKIFRYWSKKGVDVTSEFVSSYRLLSFEGLQPAAWHAGFSVEQYMRWPASYYCGGVDRSDLGKLFGTSMYGEDIIRKDPESLTGFLHQFCTQTLPWFYLNRLKRLEYIKEGNEQKVIFSEGVVTSLLDEDYAMKRNGEILLHNGDTFIPALWTKKPTIIAYSTEGYESRQWTLPADWENVKNVNIYRLTIDGMKLFRSNVAIVNRQLTLSVNQGEALIITIQN